MASDGATARRVGLRRVPLMAIAVLSMACGAWVGLIRLGWALPLPADDHVLLHGPLMVCGFLGTLIGLERAVALRSAWGYAAPALVAAGTVMLGLPIEAGKPLILGGSAVLVAIFVVLLRRHPSLFMLTMAIGALAWLVGNGFWLSGMPIFRIVWWWIAFLVLTIAGERLELSRVLRPTFPVRAVFVSAALLLMAGVVAAAPWPALGVRLAGAGLLVMAAWLMRHDVARRTVRQAGVTRYMAVGLLAGYAWLGVSGLLALWIGPSAAGFLYDATLHATFLGFVMSMVFAHAPVIFPAVLGRPPIYAPRFYAHLVVLHGSLLVRITGDLNPALFEWRRWGGLLNAVALVIFVLNVVRSIAVTRPAR